MIRVPESARRDLLHVCRRLYERGLVAGSDGNVSIRTARDQLLATPTGQSKGYLEPDDLVVCDLQGRQLAGTRRLTTEIKIHLAAYQVRDDVCAVVHAHPPFATAFAVAGTTPSEKLMPEAYIAVGPVALAPYGTPSTDELAEMLQPHLREHDAVLLANHGAMTLGRDVIAACHRMEALEQLCRVTFITRVLGSARQLGAEEVARLEAIRGVYGSAPSNVPCYQCGWSPGRQPAGAPAGDARSASAVDRLTSGSPLDRPTSSSAEADAERATPTRPSGYTEPAVHWPGNPPMWERPGSPATLEEAHVRDLARRELHRSADE